MDERAALRVLLVDDEVLIRMMVSDMLDDLGHAVVAEAGELDQSLILARSADFDLAILDVNLDGARIDPLAKAIVDRRIPFILASGYSGVTAKQAAQSLARSEQDALDSG